MTPELSTGSVIIDMRHSENDFFSHALFVGRNSWGEPWVRFGSLANATTQKYNIVAYFRLVCRESMDGLKSLQANIKMEKETTTICKSNLTVLLLIRLFHIENVLILNARKRDYISCF